MENRNITVLSKSFSNEMMSRVVRLETKLVRGFSELGIDLDAEHGLSLDDEKRILHTSTLGRAHKVMVKAIQDLGGSHFGEEYKIHFNGKFAGTIVFDMEILK